MRMNSFLSYTVHILVVCLKIQALYGYCPQGWLKHGTKCYIAYPHRPGWSSAQTKEAECRENDGILMTIKTKELNNMAFVLMDSIGGQGAIIGLNRRKEEGFYRWSDDTKLENGKWSNWAEGPVGFPTSKNEDCVQLTGKGEWAPIGCLWYFTDDIVTLCESPIAEHIIVKPKQQRACTKK